MPSQRSLSLDLAFLPKSYRLIPDCVVHGLLPGLIESPQILGVALTFKLSLLRLLSRKGLQDLWDS
jgi:hypothetical protein